jgi:hypothetical protein
MCLSPLRQPFQGGQPVLDAHQLVTPEAELQNGPGRRQPHGLRLGLVGQGPQRQRREGGGLRQPADPLGNEPPPSPGDLLREVGIFQAPVNRPLADLCGLGRLGDGAAVGQRLRQSGIAFGCLFF